MTGPLNQSLIINARPNDSTEGLKLRINGVDKLSLLQDGNATFAGTISSGAITSTGASSFTDLAIGGAADSNYDLKVYGLARFQSTANFVSSGSAIQIGGTTIVDASRNLTNIGTASISGTATVGNLDIPANGTANTRIEIGTSTTANHNAFIDLVGDTTYTDYGLRFIRFSGGANTNSQIVHRGTGGLFIEAQDAGSVILKTNGSDGLTINSSQNATFAGDILLPYVQ